LPQHERIAVSAGTAFAKAGASVITFPEFVAETVTGRQIITPETKLGGVPIGGLSREYHHKMFSTGYVTPGAIGAGIGKIMGSDEDWKRVERNPLEAFFATGGEIYGFIAGGTLMGGVKTTVARGVQKSYSTISFQLYKRANILLPSEAKLMSYHPKTLVRSWWVRRGAKEVPFEDIHNVESLMRAGGKPGQRLAFAKGKTAEERLAYTLKKLKETQTKDGDFFLGAATGGKVGRKFVVKPKVLHELPATSHTPLGEAPTRFYRLGLDTTYASRISLLPKGKLPSMMVTKIKKYIRPKGKTYKEVGAWGIKQQKGPWAAESLKMRMYGPETEINIFGGQILKRILKGDKSTLLQRIKGYKHFVKVEGHSIPVVYNVPIGEGFPKATVLLGGDVGRKGAKKILSAKTRERIKEFADPTYSSEGVAYTPVLGKHILGYGAKPTPSPSSPLYQDDFLGWWFQRKRVDRPILDIEEKSRSRSHSKSKSIISVLSTPSAPSGPSVPSAPSGISAPSAPSTPSAPSGPSVPSAPSGISAPSAPSGVSKPSYMERGALPVADIVYIEKKKKKPTGKTARKRKHPVTLLDIGVTPKGVMKII